MTAIINGSSPSVTFSDSTTQSTAFTGKALSATPYTTSLGANTLVNNTGASNTAIGNGALASNTSGANNTAIGYQSGYSNLTGGETAFFGWKAGYASTASYNTAFGSNAMPATTSGSNNNAFGQGTLYSNTTGSSNTAIGHQSLLLNTTASNNTAVGYQAGYSNTVGSYNTLIGYQAGYSISGSGNTLNTFVGQSAGYNITTGTQNTIIGTYNGNQGGLDIRTASNYIVLSDGAGNPRAYCTGAGDWTTQGNITAGAVIAVGQTTFRATSSTGTGYMGFIGTATAFQIAFNSTSAGVQLGSGATSWASFSDARLKNVTGTYTNALADISKIEPVKFTWKADAENKPQVGVLAQSVQEVVPEAVELLTMEMDSPDEYLTVRYTELIPLMIASIQELSAKVVELEAKVK